MLINISIKLIKDWKPAYKIIYQMIDGKHKVMNVPYIYTSFIYFFY